MFSKANHNGRVKEGKMGKSKTLGSIVPYAPLPNNPIPPPHPEFCIRPQIGRKNISGLIGTQILTTVGPHRSPQSGSKDFFHGDNLIRSQKYWYPFHRCISEYVWYENHFFCQDQSVFEPKIAQIKKSQFTFLIIRMRSNKQNMGHSNLDHDYFLF